MIELETAVFTLTPEAYDIDVARLNAWLNGKTSAGWTISHLTHEIQDSGKIILFVMAQRNVTATESPK